MYEHILPEIKREYLLQQCEKIDEYRYKYDGQEEKITNIVPELEAYVIPLFVLVAGSRSLTSSHEVNKVIFTQLDKLVTAMQFECHKQNHPFETHIINGAAAGVDQIASDYAKMRGYILHEFPAPFDKYPVNGGFIRNEQMYEWLIDQRPWMNLSGRKDSNYEVNGNGTYTMHYPYNKHVICFHDNFSTGLGTVHHIRLAEQYHIAIRYYEVSQTSTYDKIAKNAYSAGEFNECNIIAKYQDTFLEF